jgi:hypothetical protein
LVRRSTDVDAPALSALVAENVDEHAGPERR